MRPDVDGGPEGGGPWAPDRRAAGPETTDAQSSRQEPIGPDALGDHEPALGRDRSHRRPRGRGRRLGVIALGALALVLAALSAYLWLTTARWTEAADDWRRLSQEVTDELAGESAELDRVTGELAEVRDQLATAQTRITQLADEKAQLGDERESQRQLADYQARVTSAAAVVASSLELCTQAQGQLITYLGNRELYDAQRLDEFASEVEDVCAEAKRANAALQQELRR